MKIPEKPPKILDILNNLNSNSDSNSNFNLPPIPNLYKMGHYLKLVLSVINGEDIDIPKKEKDILLNVDYVHWEDLKYKNISLDKEELWLILQALRAFKFQNFKIKDYDFKYCLTNTILKRIHKIDKATFGEMNEGLKSLSEKYKRKYLINSLLEEAIASSQIEGATTTRKKAKEMILQQKKPTNNSEKMIYNGYNTMEYIYKELLEEKLTPELILKLHMLITDDTLEKKEDELNYRDNDDIIVGDSFDTSITYHTPPKHNQVPELMEEFCKFANSDEDGYFIPPIIKGIILHFLIGYIHPFNDGNGRTARAIFYWYVLSRGYYGFRYTAISRILKNAKKKYAKAYLYSETDENDLTYFINYNLDAIEKSIDEMNNYISKKEIELLDFEKQYSESSENLNLDLNSRQLEILKYFYNNPKKYITIKEIQNIFVVAYDTARNDLELLVKNNKIIKRKSGKRFEYTALMND
ncbi:Fic family protein [Methanococcus voltae]|uniref:Filamentation induced by cAMP protein Fic n=1 Tax=Methanococcus voltae (strain ATCC BAA-1334 / A3) TaxID=456320 RepID=D7DT34_METV3|nr:Fic family protein [Methanococcus voltae]MCS3901850.1 Fic family protein [Methanococcus voltae]